jgi:DNA-directed RNA polymerase subunit RPC12/RpoP
MIVGKKCSRCSVEKKPTEFTKDKSQTDGLSRWCKACKSLSDKRYKNQPGGGKQTAAIVSEAEAKLFVIPKKQKAKINTKRGRKPVRNEMTLEERKMYYKEYDSLRRVKKYGITNKQHIEMLESQNYKCLICSEEIDFSSPIDHCHNSGIVRGILCRYCNVGLGFFKDDPVRLKQAIVYLGKSPTTTSVV